MEDPLLIRIGRLIRSFAQEASQPEPNQAALHINEVEKHIGNATHHIASWAADIQSTVSDRFQRPSSLSDG